MEHDYIIGWIPWPVAVATTIWFCVMAHKARKNRLLWGISGGVLGLVVTTIILGLAQATFIPFHSGEIAPFRAMISAMAVLVVFCLGWLFTGSMHRRLRALWKHSEQITPATSAKPLPAAEATAKPPAAAVKR
jgi:hypothetical protein